MVPSLRPFRIDLTRGPGYSLAAVHSPDGGPAKAGRYIFGRVPSPEPR